MTSTQNASLSASQLEEIDARCGGEGKAVLEQIDVETREIAAMSRWMYEHPEFSLEEHATSDRSVECLSARGFRITRGVADMTTAFVAEKGDADQLSDR